VPTLPERSLNLVNPHTGESFRDAYWADGTYLEGAFQQIDWLLRDYHTGQMSQIDPALLDLLYAVDTKLRIRRPIEVLSGYRSPQTNRELRVEGLGAAANSMHLAGRAVDIRVQGAPLAAVRQVAMSLRAGGVGYYPEERFLHVDTGQVRAWRR
jgi:uncharacterized protein YcbK (DUF882 family)